MKWVPRLLPALIGSAALALGAGFALKQSWLTIVLILLVNGLWWWGRQRVSNLLTHFAFAADMAAAALGCGIGWGQTAATQSSASVRLLMLLGTVLALGAWDLALFTRRMKDAAHTSAVERLEGEHLKLLLGVMGAGLFLAILPQVFKLDLIFPIALGLGVVLLLSWSGVVGFLRKG